jgi:thiol-disulfide isomerase/thioredoxin
LGHSVNPINELHLTVGDKVPDLQFTMVNYPLRTVKLSEFYGKLVLLDFWGTWCLSCISRFPKLDSLQNKFKDQFQIILVNTVNTGDTEKKILEFINKWSKNGKKFPFGSAVNDSITPQLFPHNTLPHYVWIGSNGTVKAITSFEEATADNIKKLLSTEAIKLPVKRDFEQKTLLQLPDDITSNDISHYSLFIKGKLPGLSAVNTPRYDSTDKICGRAMRNTPILTMYKEAINGIDKEIGFNKKKLVLEVDDSSKLFLNKEKTSRETWEKNNLYTYDLILPQSDSKEVCSYILNDLNRYSEYFGRIEKRKIKCVALTRINKVDKLKTKNAKSEDRLYNDLQKKYISNLPMSRLVLALDRLTAINLLVVDETNYTENIDIELSVDLTDVNAIKKALRKYDLDLIEKEKEVNMFVLSDKVKKD